MKCAIYEEKELHMTAPIDTSAMDEEFYRRMRLFDAMFPDRGLDKWSGFSFLLKEKKQKFKADINRTQRTTSLKTWLSGRGVPSKKANDKRRSVTVKSLVLSLATASPHVGQGQRTSFSF